MSNPIQPSNDPKATALAVAARICNYGDFNDNGALWRTNKESALQKAEIIASVAAKLLAVTNEK